LNSAKLINSLISYFNKIINLLNTIFKNEPYIWPHYIETIPEPETAQQEEKESTSEETEIDFSLDQLFGEGTETQEKKESEELSSESDHESEKLIEDKTIEEDSKKEENSAAAQVTISDETEQAIAKEIKQKTLRVNVSKIEDIMSLVGELVVNRSSFNQLTQEIRSFSKMTKLLPEMEINLERIIKDFLMKLDSSTTTLGRLINQIQEGVMRIRMLPVSNLFNRFPRMVREISKEAGKQVDLMLIGEETELDKTVIEEISDPLIHIIRNAIDHGIEDEETRKKRNKPPKGLLKISAFHDGGKINIVVSDDGRGINKTEVVKKAVEQGLIKKEQTKYLSDSEIYQFLFHPGFSTSEKVSSLSGRGVGLDVVKRNIENLNGSIIIFSKEDEGTEITIQIPLTLAIIQALLVGVGGETYCIPITSVIETLKVKPQEIETIEDNAVFYYRDKVISIIYLKELFEIDHSDNGQDERFIVVVNSGKDLIGIVVDKLIGQHDIVIKPLEEELISSEGISGAAILGSGKIALIIDIPSVGRMHYRIKKQKREYLEAAESFTDETN
jgi:two-component system chemotaxis sensor kinase CheA